MNVDEAEGCNAQSEGREDVANEGKNVKISLGVGHIKSKKIRKSIGEDPTKQQCFTRWIINWYHSAPSKLNDKLQIT